MRNRVRYLVMEQGGCDLYRLRKRMPDEKFSVVTTLHIVKQAVSASAPSAHRSIQMTAVQALHELSFIHRDIKAHNLVTAMTPLINKQFAVSIKLIDFGTARRWRDHSGTCVRSHIVHTRTGVHVTERTYCPVAVGTTRYNSVRAHQYRDKSRACDVWGVLYVALEMLAGTTRLPWHSTAGNTMLAQMKQDADHRVCAQGGDYVHTPMCSKFSAA